MQASRRHLPVRFHDAVWREAVRGFSGRPLVIATSTRSTLEGSGVALEALRPRDANGPDGTRLAGCAKLYLPITDGPPSQRPFAFILQLARDTDGELVRVSVAFGHRHPDAGVRSVHERAHRQLHGKFPAA
jgi:hypothetical protein